MNLKDKTKEQLIEELITLHHRVADLERRLQELKQGKEFLGDAQGQQLGEPLEDLTKLPELKKMLQQEVDHRTRLESQLAQSESLYRKLVETAKDVIWTVDLDLNYTYVSPSVTKVLGYTVEEIMSMNPLSTMTPLSRDRIVGAFQEELALEASGPRDKYASRSEEIEQHHKDGYTRWQEITTTFLRANDGSPIGILGISHDITERKQMEEELRQARDELEKTVQERTTDLTTLNETLLLEIDERRRTEEELRGSEQRLELALKGANLGLWDLYPQTGQGFVNRRSAEIVGYSLDEIQPSFGFWESLLHPDDRVRAAETLLAHLEGRTDYYEDEYRVKTKSGEWKWIFSGGKAVERDPDGKPLRMSGIYRDITDLKMTEEALREEEKRYRDLVEKANDIIYRTNANGFFILFNPVGLRITGYSKEEIGHKHYLDLIHPDYKNEVERLYGLQFVKRIPDTYHEVPIITKQGETVWIGQNVHLVLEGDAIVGFQSVARDITDRKKAEDALRESEQRYGAFLNSTTDLAFLKDETFRYLMVNKANQEFFGKPEVEIVGKTDFELMPPSAAEKCRQSDVEALGSEGIVVTEEESGERIFETKKFAVPLGNGQNGIGGLIRDITDRKRAEEVLQTTLQRFYTILSSMYAGVLLVTDEGRVEFANQAFCDLFDLDDLPSDLHGLTPPEMIQKIQDVYAHPAEAVARIQAVLAQQLPVAGEEVAIRGGRTYLRDFIPIFIDGKGYGRLWHHHDITDRKRAEEGLFTAKREWEDTFNSINDMVTIHDKDYNVIHYNTAATRLLGLPNLVTSDVIKCYQLYHGKDCPPETCPSCRCLQTLQQEMFEFFEPHLNMFVEVRAIPKFDRDGQLTGLVHIVRDITERKISEELIRMRLELLEFSATNSLDELLQKTLDEVGSLTDSPIGFYHFISEDEKTISLQAWSTRTVNEFCQAEGKGRHYPVDQGGVWVDAVRERRPVIHNDYASLPHRKGMPEGHAPVIRELVVPIMRSNRIVGILGIGNKPTDYTEKDVEIVSYLADVAWEITERKRTEDALKESDKQYRTLFEDSIDGVYSVLRDGTMTDANPSFCELFGYTRQEMIGKDIRDLYFDPIDRPRFQKEIEKTGFVKDYEIKFQNRYGTEVDCLVSSSMIFEKDGSITGYRGIVRDLTARKELHRQLQQAQKMEAVGTLAGGIAHDFNNLLTIVMGFSELLLAEKDPKHSEYADLQKIFHAAKNGAELVQRLLMFSRKSDTRPVPMNLNKQIVQVEKLLRRTIPKMIEIRLDLSSDLPNINADPSQIEQVLMNLAVNARDAMSGAGKITVKTEIVKLDEEHCRLHVEANPGEYVSAGSYGHRPRDG